MRTAGLIALLAGACGSTAKTTPPPVNPPPSNQAPPKAETVADRVCQRFVRLQEQKCSKFEDLDAGPGCAKAYDEAAKDPQTAAFLVSLTECVTELDTCADVVACMGAINDDSEGQKLRACDDKSDQTMGQPVGEPRAAWKQHVARKATKFSEIKSTKAQPIEVCGIPTENAWLVALTCNDGTHPMANNADAEQARVGNLGDGGRCSSIIDLYRVKCPEATYDIYLDGYVCPLPK